MKLVCHIIKYINMVYHKYKHMLDSELESYLSYLYYQRRLKTKNIAIDLGCSQATVSRLMKKFQIKTSLNKSRINPLKYGFANMTHLILTISECIQAGMNKKEIAAHLKCSKRTVIRLCNKYGI